MARAVAEGHYIRGAAATLDALARGASDYVTKPANVGSVTMAMDAVRRELIPKIKAFCRRGAPIAPPPTTSTARRRATPCARRSTSRSGDIANCLA